MPRTLRPLVALVMVVTLFSSVALTTSASAVTVPECAYSSITVSVGATSTGGAGNAASTRVIPVIFTNHGVACHLALTGPEIIAYRDARLSKKSTVTQDAAPAVWGGQRWIVLTSKARGEAKFKITALSNTQMKSHACGVQTAKGFLVEGYALPVKNWIYFARKLPNVCFYTGPGSTTTNVRLVWVGPK